MADQYLGEIRIVGFTFAPRGWAFCDGQLLAISQNTALFSLLGTYYGGDGRTTFALPNFQGAAPMHWGDGRGLTPRSLGEAGGAASVTLDIGQMPAHAHIARASTGAARQSDPTNAVWAEGGETRGGVPLYSDDAIALAAMNARALAQAGQGAPHTNLQPYLALNFIIALQGAFPPRS